MRRRNPFSTEPRQIHVPEYYPDLSVLDCLEAIANETEDCQFSDQFLQDFKPFLDRVATALNVNNNQVMFLCAYLNSSPESMSKENLQHYFECSSIKIIRHWDDIEDLCNKGYITLCSGKRGDINAEYVLSDEGLDALRVGETIRKKANMELTNSQYVNTLRQVITKKRNTHWGDEDFINRINEINEQNQHLHIAKELCSTDLSKTGKAMLSFILNRALLRNEESIDADDITRIFDEDAFGLEQQLVRGEHELIQQHYLQTANTEGMGRHDVFNLTESTRERFFVDFTLTTTGQSDITGLIQPDSISAKQLFYSPEDNKQISSLGSLLTEEKIRTIRERLDKAGMRKGFCCLFYGAPGTGKTETALQLARQTGRAIMQVDFSQTRDMWYGNTEKNIKRIFTEYRNQVQSSKLMPILLFNEADAILSVRQTMDGNNHATDKTENAIQNILLQEMESFDGIMIATTNLTENLDKAFERRFLYKVEFHRPTLEAKQQIWHAMLPNVEEDVLRHLAMHYDLTGGQIENVVRKYMVNSILYGDVEDDYANLSDFCHQETLSGIESKKIGFV